MDEQVSTYSPEARVGVTAPPRARRRSRLVVWLGVLVVLLAAGLFAWHLLGPASAPAPQGRSGQAPPQPVGIAPAARGDVRVIVNALGTVTPLATVTVKTQIAGQLQQIAFSEGQIVHKGDFLAQIDPRPYQAALEQYEGQLAHDQALLKQAQADLARYQTLLRQDSIARQQAEDQVFVAQQYAGAIRSDQAQIDTQKLNLVYCHIVAPVDGRVGLRQVDAGNYVQTSDANGIVVITQLQPISAIFTIAEDNLPMVQKQLHAGAKLSVDAYDRANVSQLATGELETLDNQIDTTTGTVKLRALFANTDDALFPNQFVNVRLLVDTLHGVVTVPSAAVQRGAPGTYAYLVGADSTVSVRPLKIGVTDGDKVQVVSGLAVGDRVVVDGADRLREGAHVSARENATPGQAAAASAPAASAPAPSGPAPAASAPAGPVAAPAAPGGEADQPTHGHHRRQQQNDGT
jgi:multidrug efflux system membrane fusion protein